jgi:hypothetical protein
MLPLAFHFHEFGRMLMDHGLICPPQSPDAGAESNRLKPAANPAGSAAALTPSIQPRTNRQSPIL